MSTKTFRVAGKEISVVHILLAALVALIGAYVFIGGDGTAAQSLQHIASRNVDPEFISKEFLRAADVYNARETEANREAAREVARSFRERMIIVKDDAPLSGPNDRRVERDLEYLLPVIDTGGPDKALDNALEVTAFIIGDGITTDAQAAKYTPIVKDTLLAIAEKYDAALDDEEGINPQRIERVRKLWVSLFIVAGHAYGDKNEFRLYSLGRYCEYKPRFTECARLLKSGTR